MLLYIRLVDINCCVSILHQHPIVCDTKPFLQENEQISLNISLRKTYKILILTIFSLYEYR